MDTEETAVNLGGLNAWVSSLRGIVGGLNAWAQGVGSVVLGANAKDGARNQSSDVVIGEDAQSGAPLFGLVSQFARRGEAVVLGFKAMTTDWRGTAVGAFARAIGISSSAFGRGAVANGTHSIALGRGSFTTEGGQISIGFRGGNKPTDVFIDNGHDSRYIDLIDGQLIERNPLECAVILNGMSGWDSSPHPLPDRPGGDFTIAGGRATGSETGGRVVLATTLPGAESGTQKNPLVPVVAATVQGLELLLPGSGIFLQAPNGQVFRLAISDAGCWTTTPCTLPAVQS